MQTNLIRLTLLAALTGGLAACDGSDNGQANGIAALGAGFQAAFAQARNDTPVDVDAITLLLTPTREPFEP